MPRCTSGEHPAAIKIDLGDCQEAGVSGCTFTNSDITHLCRLLILRRTKHYSCVRISRPRRAFSPFTSCPKLLNRLRLQKARSQQLLASQTTFVTPAFCIRAPSRAHREQSFQLQHPIALRLPLAVLSSPLVRAPHTSCCPWCCFASSCRA